MAQDKRESVETALAEARAAILALGIGDIDAQPRADAEESVIKAHEHIQRGFMVRAAERARNEAARIYQLYLEGKLVEKNKP